MKELIKKWLEKLACRHRWFRLERGWDYYGTMTTVYACEECGKIKKITVDD